MFQISYNKKGQLLVKLKCSDNALTGLFLNAIAMELSSLQLNYVSNFDLGLIYYYLIYLVSLFKL